MKYKKIRELKWNVCFDKAWNLDGRGIVGGEGRNESLEGEGGRCGRWTR